MTQREQAQRRPFKVVTVTQKADQDGKVCDYQRQEYIVTAVDWQDALCRGECDGVLVTDAADEPSISVGVEPISSAEYDRLFQAAMERGRQPVHP